MLTTRRMVPLGVLALLMAVVGCSGSDDDGGSASPVGPEEVTGAGFYDVPDPLPEGEPGRLLRYQQLDTLPPGVKDARVFRMMYLSASREGEAIVVTGLAAIPQASAVPSGRPLLGVGHATTGIADACAPSKDPGNLAGELRATAPYLDAGYLVAMTDYEGLGTPGRHPYLVGGSEGRSVLDAVRAARRLPGADAGDRFALVGYQQGAHAALWAAELAGDWAPELDLIATAVGAPLSEMDFEWSVATSIDGLVYFLDLIAAGFHAGYPETDLGSLFTPQGLTQLDAVDRSCAADLVGATAGSRLDGILRPDAAHQEPWARIAADNIAGTAAVDAPLLVVHSRADEVVPIHLSADLTARLCAAGQEVERVVLQDGDGHLAATIPTYAVAFDWLQALLEHQPPTSSCPQPTPTP